MNDFIVPQDWRYTFRGDRVKSIRTRQSASGLKTVRLTLVQGGAFDIVPEPGCEIRATLINIQDEARDIVAMHELKQGLTRQVWLYAAHSLPQFAFVTTGDPELGYHVTARPVLE